MFLCIANKRYVTFIINNVSVSNKYKPIFKGKSTIKDCDK